MAGVESDIRAWLAGEVGGFEYRPANGEPAGGDLVAVGDTVDRWEYLSCEPGDRVTVHLASWVLCGTYEGGGVVAVEDVYSRG